VKAVLVEVADSLRAWGYRGSGQNYRMLLEDIIFVINFQKSRTGDHFFLNLGAQPTTIPGAAETDPNLKTQKEYECVFRFRLPGDWNTTLSHPEIESLTAALDGARKTFESRVSAMRTLSRGGQGTDLFEQWAYLGTAARAPLVLARLLAADGHHGEARVLAERAIATAGGASLLRAAAQRLLDNLPGPGTG